MRNLKPLVPELYKLALLSSQADVVVGSANTPRSISKAASEKLIIDTKLAEHLRKLSSAVLDSLASNKKKDELKEKIQENNSKPNESRQDKTAGISPGRALALSSGLSLPAGLTAMALMNEADDKIDARLAAIPGVAAATVAAILAAKNMSKKEVAEKSSSIKELSDAIKVSFVIDKLSRDQELNKVAEDLTIANKRHISALVNDLLFN